MGTGDIVTYGKLGLRQETQSGVTDTGAEGFVQMKCVFAICSPYKDIGWKMTFRNVGFRGEIKGIGPFDCEMSSWLLIAISSTPSSNDDVCFMVLTAFAQWRHFFWQWCWLDHMTSFSAFLWKCNRFCQRFMEKSLNKHFIYLPVHPNWMCRRTMEPCDIMQLCNVTYNRFEAHESHT